jgi:CheY-like chemotaxis protein
VQAGQTAASEGDVHVLIADDDAPLRTLYVCIFEAIAGVRSVVAARDGAEATAIAAEMPLHIAILDFNMPRLNGVEAALRMRALQPALRIALHTSDSAAIRDQAIALGMPLFDKLEADRLTDWVEAQSSLSDVNQDLWRNRSKGSEAVATKLRSRRMADGIRTQRIPEGDER